jgi:uncharacterized membrane protein YbhN (UPF0104 family)
MKKFLKRINLQIAILLISFVTLFCLGAYLYSQAGNLLKITNIDIKFILSIAALYFLHFIFLGLTHKLPLKKHGIELSFKDWFGLCSASEFLNLVFPAKGGTALRMIFLKRNYQLSMRSFLSMNFAVIVSAFTVFGLLGALYIRFNIIKPSLVFIMLESIFWAMSISGILLIIANETLSKIFNFQRKINPKLYLKDISLILKTTLLYFAIFSLYPLKIFLTFKSVGISINFLDSFEISLAIILISIFQVIPGNIGIKEILTAYLASQYGISFEMALLASLIDRAIMFLFLFPIGTYFYWTIILNKSIRKNFLEAYEAFNSNKI